MTHPQFNFGPAEAQQEYSDVFNTLNAAQRQAVRSTATSLQILAGPGSGKTRVLTTRAAYLIRERNLDPKSLMVVTFTKKAARDMRLKLHRMLGDENFNLLRVGTFHSVCLELLNKHAALVGFQENLSVINDKESKDIMKELQATVEPIEDITVDLTTAWEMIKNSKDKGETLEDFRYKVARLLEQRRTNTGIASSESYNKLVYIANMYRAYEAKLREGNLIDYGSLLLWTVELLKKNRSLLSHIRALLIDEFQDSNGTQFELILEIMKQENPKLLTIVGDPDQAIYGWRSAGPENFNKIRTSIRNTEIVILHENYRSTKCILRAATSVIEQDENRIPKPLTTFNPEGVKMTYMRCQNAFDQAEFISKEIRRCVNESGGVLRHRDVAVLVRTHNLSREIQREFERNGIPYNVVNNRFLEEGPVMDVLAYLGFVHNPFNFIDFKRIINLPKRHIGNVTQEALLNLNKQQGTDFLSTLKYAQSVITKKINVTARISIAAFVAVCESATQMMDENASIRDILTELVEGMGYRSSLAAQPEKWAKVQKLIDNADDIADYVASTLNTSHPDSVDKGSNNTSHKRVALFLEYCSMSTDLPDFDRNRVTICTLHSAKGLEWPCVFITSVTDDLIPFHKSPDQNEENRLFYVGMTRAQFLLYCTTVQKFPGQGNQVDKVPSHFIEKMDKRTYSGTLPDWTETTKSMLAETLRKNGPDMEMFNEIEDSAIDEYLASLMTPIVLTDNV